MSTPTNYTTEITKINTYINTPSEISAYSTTINGISPKISATLQKIPSTVLQTPGILNELNSILSSINTNTQIISSLISNIKSNCSSVNTTNGFELIFVKNVFNLNQIDLYLNENITQTNNILEITKNLKFTSGQTASYATDLNDIDTNCNSIISATNPQLSALQTLMGSINANGPVLANTLATQIATNITSASEAWKLKKLSIGTSIIASALNGASEVVKNYKSMVGSNEKVIDNISLSDIYLGLAGLGTTVNTYSQYRNYKSQTKAPSGAKVDFANAMAAAGKVEYEEVLAALEKLQNTTSK